MYIHIHTHIYSVAARSAVAGKLGGYKTINPLINYFTGGGEGRHRRELSYASYGRHRRVSATVGRYDNRCGSSARRASAPLRASPHWPGA